MGTERAATVRNPLIAVQAEAAHGSEARAAL